MIKQASLGLLSFAVLFGTVGAVRQAAANAIVALPSLANTWGDSNNFAPLGTLTASRVQQVYSSTLFADQGGPFYIDSVAFRTATPFDMTIPGLTINLSTTQRGPGGLSPIYAANVGADVQTVHDGSIDIFSRGAGSISGQGPNSGGFGLVINFEKPFLYDPSAGNLLLDINNPFSASKRSSSITGYGPSLDATALSADLMSRVMSYVGPADPNNPYATSDLSHGQPDPISLITKFTIGSKDPTPQPPIPADLYNVPEPGTVVVLALGMAGILWSRRGSTRDRKVRAGSPGVIALAPTDSDVRPGPSSAER